MLIAVAVLGAIGLIAALILFVCSKKFYVYEDPRMPTVADAASQDVAAWQMHWSKVPMPVASTD